MSSLERKPSSELNKPKIYQFFLKQLKEVLITVGEEKNPIRVGRKSITKILALNQKKLPQLENYVSFVYEITTTRTTEEEIVTFNVEYKLLICIIKFFHINVSGQEILVKKESVEKIFKMLQYDSNQIMHFLDLFQVEKKTIFGSGLKRHFSFVDDFDYPTKQITSGTSAKKFKQLNFLLLNDTLDTIINVIKEKKLKEEEERKKIEEEKRIKEEEEKKRLEEEKRIKEEEEKKRLEEEKRIKEEEEKRKREEEERRIREEEEKKRLEEEKRIKEEEERRKLEEEKRIKEEEEKKKREEEEKRIREEEEKKRLEEEKRIKEEEEKKKKEEEERIKEEEERKRLEEEKRKLEEEEEKKKLEEEKRIKEEEEKKKIEEEKKKLEEEKRKLEEEEKKKKLEEEKRIKEEEERKRLEEEEKRKEEEERRKQEEQKKKEVEEQKRIEREKIEEAKRLEEKREKERVKRDIKRAGPEERRREIMPMSGDVPTEDEAGVEIQTPVPEEVENTKAAKKPKKPTKLLKVPQALPQIPITESGQYLLPISERSNEEDTRKDEPVTIVTFSFEHRVKKKLQDKAKVCVTGSNKELGLWDTSKGVQLIKSLENDQKYEGKVKIHRTSFPFEYKYYVVEGSKVTWEGKPYVNYSAPSLAFEFVRDIFATPHNLKLMNCNIRYVNDTDKQNIWDNRKEKIVELFLSAKSDVIFILELTKIQLKYLKIFLSGLYEHVGLFRDSTERTEEIPIFYKKGKMIIHKWGQFWLSSTPDVPGSNDLEFFFPRMCTWGKFTMKDQKERYLIFNTHFDHVNFESNKKGVKILLSQIKKVISENEADFAILNGCFYCEKEDEIIQRIVDDEFIIAPFGNTFHDFTGEANKHWDFLFYKKLSENNVSFNSSYVCKAESIVNKDLEIFISDHYPYWVNFTNEN